MNANDIKFLHSFNTIPGVGPATLRALYSFFGSYEQAWNAGQAALKEALTESRAERIISWKKPSLHPDREMEFLIRSQITIIHEEDPHYPSSLKEIHQPPVLLYMQGSLYPIPHLAIVGTRRPTTYGREITENFARVIANADVAIVSGLALGIDTVAHLTTLDTNGKTVAVLGSGIDQESIFPSENRMLAKKIVEAGGAVISEYAPKTPAVKEHFPQRNRIISGMSLGVLVVEARERSGALITTQFALDQNRDVFAVPGSLFSPTSRGPHRLIQQGAKLVMTPHDLLEEIGISYTKGAVSGSHEPLDETEQIIMTLLEEPLSLDSLKLRMDFPIAMINATLSRLELKGLIINMGQDTYQKI
ncbi:MAG: DNA-protecting protein DprA [Candidatus Colwellbacteria bacterium]|nr:DNA-protecting protein DprA [Candidatus Colwellbacteria bacterium]